MISHLYIVYEKYNGAYYIDYELAVRKVAKHETPIFTISDDLCMIPMQTAQWQIVHDPHANRHANLFCIIGCTVVQCIHLQPNIKTEHTKCN
jgi:hypothetical protein